MPPPVPPPDAFDAMVEKHQLSPRCISGVGDGWVPIVDDMLTAQAAGWTGAVGQIKEKFGKLTIYISDVAPEHNAIVAAAAERAARTCEKCGAPGHFMVRNGWCRTACVDCGAK